MSIKPASAQLDRQDLTFLSDLGWLTALAFAVVTYVPVLLA
jgi:hypothetical protein